MRSDRELREDAAEARADATCGCCGVSRDKRDPDPWEGRLDAYCETCALARCDAYPGDCPVTRWANKR